MKLFDLRAVFTATAICLLTACGGGVDDSPTTTAGLTMHGGGASVGPAPVADCEAEGCNRPRIIDGLAEQYRASAAERAALPAGPAQAGDPLAEVAGAEPSAAEAAYAAAAQAQ